MVAVKENVQERYISLSSLVSAVGGTPLLPLQRIAQHVSPQVKVYAKAEWFNPGGSVKDRPALNIIRSALDHGELGNGQILLDATSGNMGIAYATLGASMGIPVSLAVPGNVSPERIKILKALGADLYVTDSSEGMEGAMSVVHQMLEESPDKYYFADQHNNPANWEAHYYSTGPEIWQQSEKQVTHFVAGMGTSGTITGVTHFLKEQSNDVECIGFYPNAPQHGLEGLKHMPSANPPGIYHPELLDQIFEIGTEEAYEMVQRLGREEGLFVGISSGAAALAALQVAESLDKGMVVTLFPDAGYKYLSKKMWY